MKKAKSGDQISLYVAIDTRRNDKAVLLEKTMVARGTLWNQAPLTMAPIGFKDPWWCRTDDGRWLVASTPRSNSTQWSQSQWYGYDVDAGVVDTDQDLRDFKMRRRTNYELEFDKQITDSILNGRAIL